MPMDPEELRREQDEELLAALRAVPDLEERIRAIDSAHDHNLRLMRITQASLAELRKDTINDMLKIMSKSEVARRLGVTRGRIGQVVGTGVYYPAMHRRTAVSSEDADA